MQLTVHDTFGRLHSILTTDADTAHPRWFLQDGNRELVRVGDDIFMVIDQPNAAPLRVVRRQVDNAASF
jgi:hypothetical protein